MRRCLPLFFCSWCPNSNVSLNNMLSRVVASYVTQPFKINLFSFFHISSDGGRFGGNGSSFVNWGPRAVRTLLEKAQRWLYSQKSCYSLVLRHQIQSKWNTDNSHWLPTKCQVARHGFSKNILKSSLQLHTKLHKLCCMCVWGFVFSLANTVCFLHITEKCQVPLPPHYRSIKAEEKEGFCGRDKIKIHFPWFHQWSYSGLTSCPCTAQQHYTAVSGERSHTGAGTKTWNIKRCPDSPLFPGPVRLCLSTIGKRKTVNYFVHITHVPQLRQHHLVTVPEITAPQWRPGKVRQMEGQRREK